MQEIEFNYELDFSLKSETKYKEWLLKVIDSEGYSLGSLSYIFCTDDYLQGLHSKYLKKDSLTDIITFDYRKGKEISGDVFISIERVRENAQTFAVHFDEELSRVMVHGVLHIMGYSDKEEEDRALMRAKEDEKIKLFHVER